MNTLSVIIKHVYDNSFDNFLKRTIDDCKSEGRRVFFENLQEQVIGFFSKHSALSRSEYISMIQPALDISEKVFRKQFRISYLNKISEPKHYLSRSIWHDKLLDDPKYKKDVDDIIYLSSYEARKMLKEKESNHPFLMENHGLPDTFVVANYF